MTVIPARSHELRSYSITISIAQEQQIYSWERNLSPSKHTGSGEKKNITAATPLEDQRGHTTGHSC